MLFTVMPKAKQKTKGTAEITEDKVQLIRPWTVEQAREHWAIQRALELDCNKFKPVQTDKKINVEQDVSTSEEDEVDSNAVEIITISSIDSTSQYIHPQYTHGDANDVIRYHKGEGLYLCPETKTPPNPMHRSESLLHIKVCGYCIARAQS